MIISETSIAFRRSRDYVKANGLIPLKPDNNLVTLVFGTQYPEQYNIFLQNELL